MKKNDIISELFSLLKNQNVEERIFTISNILNKFYIFEGEYEELAKLPHTTIKRYLETIIQVVNNKTSYKSQEEAIEEFCINMSSIDYLTFKKMLSKYNIFGFFQKHFELNQETIKNIGTMVIMSAVSVGALLGYGQIDKTLVDVDYPISKSSVIAYADIPSVEKDINSILEKSKEELKKEEEKELVNDETQVTLDESTTEYSTNSAILSEDSNVLETEIKPSNDVTIEPKDDLELFEEPISAKELEPLNLKKPVTENILGEYEIPLNVNQEEIQPVLDDIIQYVLDRYNITLEQFNVVKGVVIAEAKWDSFEDGYAVINTIYNRTQSEKWLYTAEYCYKDSNGNRLKLDGTNIYDVVISPNQFQVYTNGRYLKYIDKEDGPVYDAIKQFFEDLKNKNYEKMHDFLNFKSSGTEMTCYYVQFVSGGNKYHGIIDDRIVTEENTKSIP